MRTISVTKIRDTVAELCIKANTVLRKDILSSLKAAANLEKNTRTRNLLKILIDNARIAKEERLAICQDTGMASVYLDIGQDVKITGGSLEEAVNDGVRLGYRKGYFRNSVVDPVTRKNTGTNAPAIVHTKLVNGNKIKIAVMPKGFGCENKNQIRMFKPTAGIGEVKKFIVDVVRQAGPDACPPYIIGVGIGGTLEKAVELSKEALLKQIQIPNSKIQNKSKFQIPKSKIVTYEMERYLFTEINKLGIGPGGFGGKATTLGVNVLMYPTHIAGLPVAVSIGCHATRSAAKII